MKYDVFISHSSKDHDEVTALVEYLEKNSISCFVSYRDIPKGSVWATVITEAIENSSMMLVVFSENFNNSEQVDREIEMICNEKKPIITLKINDVPFKGAKKYYLTNINWIAASSIPGEKYSGLAPAIIDIIGIRNTKTSNSVINREIEVSLPDIDIAQEHFICHIGRKVTATMIYQAIKIDEAVYGIEFQSIYDMCIKWWKRNPDIYVMIEDTDTQTIIGYINAMPLEDDYYCLIKSGEIIDTTIPVEAICTYDFPDTYKLYFSSIAIHPNYHNTSAFKFLYDAFLMHTLKLFDREIYFSTILADAVSPVGKKMCKWIGLNKLYISRHESEIYEGSLLPPTIKTTTEMSKRLVEKYTTL
jgi:hypothetical protein